MLDQEILEKAKRFMFWFNLIEYLESKKVNVPVYIMHILMHDIKSGLSQSAQSISKAPNYSKYKDEVEKYLMLI